GDLVRGAGAGDDEHGVDGRGADVDAVEGEVPGAHDPLAPEVGGEGPLDARNLGGGDRHGAHLGGAVDQRADGRQALGAGDQGREARLDHHVTLAGTRRAPLVELAVDLGVVGRVAAELGQGHAVLFFFRAEDGIRDYKVTGVQ